MGDFETEGYQSNYIFIIFLVLILLLLGGGGHGVYTEKKSK